MAAEAAVEYLSSIYANKPADIYTNIWLSAIPDDDAREKGSDGADQRKIEDLDDIREFVSEWYNKRNIYYKAARFQENADGTRIVDAQVFCFAWIDIDLVSKPEIAPARLIDMACDMLDTLKHKPSVIVSTGGGVQALWHFKTPIVLGVTPKAHAWIESINRNLSRVFGGDPAPSHPAGGLRLPGTINLNRTLKRAESNLVSYTEAPAKVLRMEPERLIEPAELDKELKGLGTKLFRDKMGQWHTLSGEMSKVERAHIAAAEEAIGTDNKAKTADEWDTIILDMVRKGGRNVAMTKYAGKIIRAGMNEDDALANMLAKIAEATKRVRDAGQKATPPGKSEIMAVIRSVAKTETRHAEVKQAQAQAPEPEPAKPKRTRRKPVSTQVVDTSDGQAGRGEPEPEREPDPTPMISRSDPGGFFGARSVTATERANEEADTTSKPTPIDPATYDPRDPAQELRQVVNRWYAQTDSHGVRVNAGKEYPFQLSGSVDLVVRAFLATLEKNDIGLIRTNSEWWVYDDTLFTWRVVDDEYVYTLFSDFWDALLGMVCTAKRVRDFMDTLILRVSVKNVQWNVPIATGFHATLFDCGTLVLIDPKGVLSTRPVQRADMLTEHECPRVAVRWTPGATCPRIEQALRSMAKHLPDPADQDAWYEAILAWASQIFLPAKRPKHLYRAAVFFGESNTGKNFLLDIPRAVLDAPGKLSRVSTAPLTALDDSFGMQGFLGKRAWLVAEAKSAATVLSDDLLKQIITDEHLEVKVKFKGNVLSRLHLTIGVATNTLPRFNDVSAGTLSRVVYFPLQMRFMEPGKYDLNDPFHLQAIPDIEEVIRQEREGIAQLLVDRACRMMVSGKMPVTAKMEENTEQMYGSSNRTLMFLENAIQQRPTRDDWVTNADLKTAFRGMVYAEDGWTAASKVDMRQVENSLFTALRHKFHAERSKGMKSGKVREVHRRVWLTAEGIDWYMHGLKHDSGQRDKPLSDFKTLGDTVNRPLPAPGPGPGPGQPSAPPDNVTDLSKAREARAAQAGD